MKTFAKLLRLDFLPRNIDLALLVLRGWLGLTMLCLHGWDKLTHFEAKSQKFLTVFGLSAKASLGLAVFAEFVCAVFLVLGLFTRFSAVALAMTMTVAFTMAHKAVLKGPGSGELAFIYLAGFVVIFLAGPGRFSLDAKMGRKK